MKKKRISTIIAVVLLITLLGGLVAIPGMANTIAYPPVARVADPETDARPPNVVQMGFTNTPAQDGRIWTDKTVREGSDVDDFDITLSALSQSFPLTSEYEIPTDTVFIIDVSGSMRYTDAPGGPRRIEVLIEALNGAIATLQGAHIQNRIAVVAYGGVSGGLARVENLLPLDRYTAVGTPDEFFTFNATATEAVTDNFFLIVNDLLADVGAPIATRNVRVYGSTPTQWGIYEGARILETATPKTALVDLTGTGTQITVTRRPNIILMTDGEPTLGWSNYTFSPSPPNPISPGSAGTPILSPPGSPNTPPGIFFGDGSWGEMGVSLLTVLTAAHRKRLVLNSYFGSANAVTPGYPGQPSPSVGFYSIAFGIQPAGTAGELIEATMNPGNPGFVPNVDNASGILYNIRTGMSDLLTDPNGPGGTNIFKQNPNLPPGGVSPGAPPGYGGDMGNLLRAFAAPSPSPIEFHVSRRQSFSLPTSYVWDSTPLRITNTENLTLAEINFANLFATATDIAELNKVFEDITTSITNQGFQDNITLTDPDSERSFDGYLSFSDVLGEYMQVRNVGSLEYEGATFQRTAFASSIAGNTPAAVIARNEYINILYHHMNYGTDPSSDIYLPETEVAILVTSNIASSDFLARNSIRYYANTDRDFVGNYYLPNGTVAPRPAEAAAIVDVYPMWGTLSAAQAPPSGDTNLRTVTFHVITALRTAGFAELYASGTSGPMMRILNEGDQMIRWYIPSSLIPIRTPVSPGSTVYTNTLPIRVGFTVGLDKDRVTAGIPQEVFLQYQVPGTTDQMYFYSNRHSPNPTNVTVAFFRPHPENPYYKSPGAGAGLETVQKTQNRTGTAAHVSLNQLQAYDANTAFEMHWLGNNGRLTFRIVPPPEPPSPADLTILKTFTGIPSNLDVFDTDIVSQISFLVVGTNAAGTEIYRELVIFNSTNFRWNDALRGYEYMLRNVPLGTYRIYERGGNIVGYTFNRPGPPQTVSVTSPGQAVSVSFVNNYTPNPIPPAERPALTIWKVFHGLTNAQIPAGFQIRITGPGGFSQTINRDQAIAGVTYKNMELGQYTVTETGSSAPGFSMTFTINNETVSLPYTFSIDNVNQNIGINIDNYYVPVQPPSPPPQPPPSPQTGLRDFTIPIALFLLGAVIIGVAEVYRRKSKKKQ